MRPRSPKRPLVRALLLLGLAGITLHAAGCLGTGSCDSLRQRLLDERDLWAACDPSQGDEQCAIVTGDGNDCTGAFRCDFAVNRIYLAAAERGVVEVGSQSPVCEAVCSGLTCPGDSQPHCDVVTRRCRMDEFNDAGSSVQPPLEDAAPPPIENDANPGGDQ